MTIILALILALLGLLSTILPVIPRRILRLITGFGLIITGWLAPEFASSWAIPYFTGQPPLLPLAYTTLGLGLWFTTPKDTPRDSFLALLSTAAAILIIASTNTTELTLSLALFIGPQVFTWLGHQSPVDRRGIQPYPWLLLLAFVFLAEGLSLLAETGASLPLPAATHAITTYNTGYNLLLAGTGLLFALSGWSAHGIPPLTHLYQRIATAIALCTLWQEWLPDVTLPTWGILALGAYAAWRTLKGNLNDAAWLIWLSQLMLLTTHSEPFIRSLIALHWLSGPLTLSLLATATSNNPLRQAAHWLAAASLATLPGTIGYLPIQYTPATQSIALWAASQLLTAATATALLLALYHTPTSKSRAAKLSDALPITLAGTLLLMIGLIPYSIEPFLPVPLPLTHWLNSTASHLTLLIPAIWIGFWLAPRCQLHESKGLQWLLTHGIEAGARYLAWLPGALTHGTQTLIGRSTKRTPAHILPSWARGAVSTAPIAYVTALTLSVWALLYLLGR